MLFLALLQVHVYVVFISIAGTCICFFVSIAGTCICCFYLYCRYMYMLFFYKISFVAIIFQVILTIFVEATICIFVIY